MLTEIDKNLRDLEAELWKIQGEFPEQVKQATTDEVRFQIAMDNTFDDIKEKMLAVGEKPTAAGIEPLARKANHALFDAYKKSKAVVEGQKKKIDVLQSILTSTQTRSKIAMIERGLTNFQP